LNRGHVGLLSDWSWVCRAGYAARDEALARCRIGYCSKP